MKTQVQKSFEVHYSLLQENGTLARKIQVVPGISKEDATDTIKKMLIAEKVDIRKVNIYKVEEKPGSEVENKPESKKPMSGTIATKPADPKADKPKEQEQKDAPFNFSNRTMSFICDVKQSVITNKDSIRILRLTLEVSGSQVNGVQVGMLRYRPQESLKITCEPVQVDVLDDRTKKPERQTTLDDATRTKKHEEKTEHEAAKKKEKESNGKKKQANNSEKPEEKVKLPTKVLSQGCDRLGNQYYFDPETRQMYSVAKDGKVSRVDKPLEPLTQKGY